MNKAEQWVIVSVVWFAYLQSFMHRVSYSAVLPVIMKDLGISFAGAGLLLAAYMVAYSLLQAPSGTLADRLGYERLVPWFLLLMSVGMILFSFVTDLGQAVVARLLMGVGGAMMFVPGLRLLAESFAKEARGTAVGAFSSAIGIGPLIALVTMPVLEQSLGWRGSFLIMTIPVFISAVLIKLKIRRVSGQSGVRSEASGSKEGASEHSYVGIVSNPQVWLISLATLLYAGGFYGLFTFIPTYLFQVLNLPLVYAGLISGLSMGLLTIGILLFGRLSDVLGRRKFVFGGCQIATALLLLLLVRTDGLLFSVALVGLIGLFMGAEFLGYVIATESHPSAMRGAVTGFISMNVHVGALLFPVIVGYILDLTQSYSSAYILISVLLVVGGALSLVVREAQS